MGRKSKETILKKSRGRGSLINFLNETIVSKLIAIIRDLIQKSIATDKTQDISCADQCFTILRYAHEGIVLKDSCFW